MVAGKKRRKKSVVSVVMAVVGFVAVAGRPPMVQVIVRPIGFEFAPVESSLRKTPMIVPLGGPGA